MVGMCNGKGIASFCRSGGKSGEAGQNNCSPWFSPVCRQRLERKEAFLLQAFLVTFLAKKVTGSRAAKSATK